VRVEDHDRLSQLLANGGFEPFIRHIRFPRFKNVEDGTIIEFSHPISALVGTNGTNKTSILRALEGSPGFNNFGNYWFSTNLDPISASVRYRFIHGYRAPSGQVVESIKTRIANKADPDYFEPSRPILSDGMAAMPTPEATPASDRPFRSATRWSAINKPVVYLDFRHDIPAYDIFFHMNWSGRKNDLRDKKALLRRRASHVATALDGLEASHSLYRVERVLEPARELPAASRAWVSRILGRQYSSIRIVKHSFYGVEGFTVRLSTDALSYSEAFAGSGEYAVAMIVESVLESARASLVILDEPEVSLHPSAQAELMGFLTKMCLAHQHQVVISTHSPDIIRPLPPHAIKVLTHNPMTGLVGMRSQEALADEAFLQIGAPAAPKVVYVEDDLAIAFIQRATRGWAPDRRQLLSIRKLGSASTISSRHIPTIVQLEHESLVFLDGDQRPSTAIRPSAALLDAEVLPEIAQIGIRPNHLGLSGGNSDNEAEALLKGRAIADWAIDHLAFLPGETPEQLLLSMLGDNSPMTADHAKHVWVERTQSDLGLPDASLVAANDILATQRRALAVVPDDDATLVSIGDTIYGFITR
jgi:predicted ATPase